MSPTLSVVADNQPGQSPAPSENVADRVRKLQAEARSLAREHIRALEQALLQVEKMSAEIADGGEAYPAGVREVARRLAEDCEARVQTLEAISARA
ncbi:MAG: hypothetical protein ACK41C_11115 [Phenylobacterium sp.]|uniref:hypothetical protein n=1 Tax=Phenylobacterium sp. TaxID=1871053 RepID=UPI00391A9B45